jgi:hypothetical protein
MVGLAFVIGACSPAASVASPSPAPTTAPAATASLTPAPSPTPTSAPSATPAPSTAAAADPAEGLKIADPYTLTVLDPALETTFRQQFTAAAGAFGSLIGIGGREVIDKGALAGYVIVFGFPPGAMNDTSFQSMLAGMATSSQMTFTTTTISGVQVSTASSAGGTYALFHVGDHVIMLITLQAETAPAVAKALITANQ